MLRYNFALQCLLSDISKEKIYNRGQESYKLEGIKLRPLFFVNATSYTTITSNYNEYKLRSEKIKGHLKKLEIN